MSNSELVLEGAMTIAKAEALHHQLETLLQEQSKICINAKAVERADTSIIQMFSSLCDTADNLNIDVQILASDGLRECTTLLGFGGLTERYV